MSFEHPTPLFYSNRFSPVDLSSILLFDTSGIEAYVTENNPKYANRMIKQLKAYAKSHNSDDSYDPYKAAYSSMPASAAANHEVKQQYVNDHFCYAYKFGMITNELGIVRSVDFITEIILISIPTSLLKRNQNLLLKTNHRTTSNLEFLIQSHIHP